MSFLLRASMKLGLDKAVLQSMNTTAPTVCNIFSFFFFLLFLFICDLILATTAVEEGSGGSFETRRLRFCDGRR